MVRIFDVAKHAGVSIGTVSNTINHRERVSPSTQAAVWASIRELGFVPNQMARVLTGAPSRVLGLIVPDVMSPFYMEVAHAVERAARAAGHVVILCNSENEHDRETELLDVLAGQRVFGALVSPAGGDAPTTATSVVPLVFLDHSGPADACSVLVDHVAGGRMAARHLLESGHRRLAFVGGRPTLWQFTQRVDGMREALAEWELDPDSLVQVHAEGIGIDSGVAAAAELLDDLPTGICCGNDMIAFGVFRGLRAAGIEVPNDAALVGYDDVDFASSWIVPMTSVRQPTTRMGELATELLLGHAEAGDGHAHERVLLQPELIVRRSSELSARPA